MSVGYFFSTEPLIVGVSTSVVVFFFVGFAVVSFVVGAVVVVVVVGSVVVVVVVDLGVPLPVYFIFVTGVGLGTVPDVVRDPAVEAILDALAQLLARDRDLRAHAVTSAPRGPGASAPGESGPC